MAFQEIACDGNGLLARDTRLVSDGTAERAHAAKLLAGPLVESITVPEKVDDLQTGPVEQPESRKDVRVQRMHDVAFERVSERLEMICLAAERVPGGNDYGRHVE